MSDKFSVTVNVILRDSWALAVRHWAPLVSVFVVIAGAFILIDTQMDVNDSTRVGGLLGLPILYLQVMMQTRLLRSLGRIVREDEGGPSNGMFPRAFGQSILWTIGVLVGALLLIVGAVWLAVIWFVCLPVLIAEPVGVLESFGRSRAWVKPHIWTVALLWTILMSVFMVGFAAGWIVTPAYGPMTLTAALINDITYAGIQLAFWVVRVATYCRLASPSAQAANVFA